MNTLPRARMAHLPTPIEPMPRLSAALGGPNLWIKRDDQTGLALGGNKTRKLEFLVAQAQANGAQTLVTAGAVQSNHCRQTAAAAAHFGLQCILVLAGNQPGHTSGNVLLDELLGAEIVWTERAVRDQTLKQTFEGAWEAGRRPFLIPYGGSSPTGAASYAYAIKELVDQCVDSSLRIPVPDWIVFASSSGGTQAGMAAGVKLFPTPCKVLGISIDEKANVLKSRVADLANQTLQLFDAPLRLSLDEILVNDDFITPGYGVMTAVEKEAVQLFARQEGILLDPVYTGRAAAGLINLHRQGFFRPGENVMFWHTGGTPALFADQYQDINL